MHGSPRRDRREYAWLRHGNRRRIRLRLVVAVVLGAAIIGVLCGMGAYILALIATFLVLIVLSLGLGLDRWLYGKAGIKDDDRA